MQQPLLGGRYQVIRRLGSGGFSRTFLVADLHRPNHPQCVIKQLKLPHQDTGTLEMARRLFDTEARVMYQLSHHPQVPTLLAHFEEKREFYLAQEYIEGQTLDRQIKEGDPWPQERVMALLEELLAILAFVHAQQVIHRDIKPANLIRRRDGRLVLIDFGAVKQVSNAPAVDPETGATNLTVSIGTQGYMPNEQYAGKPRFSSDVYAVGMLGIRALTGIHPKHIDEDPHTSELAWQDHAPGVSTGLAAVLDRMVRYDFRDRYPTAAEALAALHHLDRNLAPLPLLLPAGEGGKANLVPESTLIPTSASVPVVVDPDSMAIDSTALDAATLGAMALDPADPDSTALLPATAAPPQRDRKRRTWRLPLLVGGIVGSLATTMATASWHSDTLSSLGPQNLIPEFLQLSRVPALPTDLSPLLPPEEQAVHLSEVADQWMVDRRYLDALALYDQAVVLRADYATAHLGRCKALMGLNRPADALVACNDALAYRSYYPEALRSQGNALEQQGNLLAALALYEGTTRQMPALFEGWLDQGRVLQKLGRSAEALQALNQAILRNRNSAEAWAVRGQANWTLNRHDQALIALDKALQLDPEQPEAKRLRAQARQMLGR